MKGERFMEIGLSDLCPNPWNGRKKFSGPKFNELVASVKVKGVLQPILARPLPDGGRLVSEASWPNNNSFVHYEVVAGERRFRAAYLVAAENGGPDHGTIPAMVRDLSDDDVFEIMTIENLQREGLTEFEEAESFRAYLDRHGEDALEGLAEKISISPSYIRRRVRVLSLPESAVSAWRDGKVRYGHMEQLCRVKDSGKIKEYLESIINPPSYRGVVSVTELKREIDGRSLDLDKALFEPEKEGCPSCGHNSAVQKKLFDFDVTERICCTDPKCFKKKTNDYLTSNFKKSKLRKKYKTNGFIFSENFDWKKHDSFYRLKDVYEKCRDCKKFVTAIHLSGEAQYERLCLDKACKSQLQSKKAKSLDPGKSAGNEDGEKDTGPRVAWHGEFFREIFFQDEIPAHFEQIPEWTDNRVMRMLLFGILCLVTTGSHFHRWFAKRHGLVNDRGESPDEAAWFFLPWSKIWETVSCLFPVQLQNDVAEIALQLILCKEMDARGRRHIAEMLGIDLATEWRLTPEYLGKKTTAEMLRLGDDLGIFIDSKAQGFLANILGKKPGRYDSCKKSELIRVFIESGADLAGKVPAEILAGDDPEPANEPGPGDAHLFEEDLQSEETEPGDGDSEDLEAEERSIVRSIMDGADPEKLPNLNGNCTDCGLAAFLVDAIKGVQIPGNAMFKCSRPGGLCEAKKALAVVEPALKCTDCEHKRAMSNKTKGVRIPGKGMGKCIREGGLCEKVETR